MLFNPISLIIIIVVYMAFMFFVALSTERKAKQGKNLVNNSIIYTLALAIYCTAWTFYGNIGLAATDGFLFLTVYIGPTLAIIFWWTLLRRMVRLRNEFGVTSIADFISVRYGKSQGVAAIATIIALIGIIPYIALQLKGIITSFTVITSGDLTASSIRYLVDGVVVGLMIIFTIIFGMRRLDLTERHPGMVMVIAIKSIIKLFALLAAGIFVTYFIYDGISDIFSRISADSELLAQQTANIPSFGLWLPYLILSMSAIMFLPRQFHIAVVENTDEKHIKSAMWGLPLYLFLITLFVIPIALGGILHGFNIGQADFFSLLLTLNYGSPWLALLVFMGGFSAAVSMIMISTMTMTTMATNYLLLPIIENIKILNWLRRYILQVRWLVVAVIILVGFWFKLKLGSSYMLVKIGMISFAAAMQFAPVIIFGLFWEKGNKAGAILGMFAGFLTWAYTALIPAFVKSGWLAESLLANGPLDIGWLRPEGLFGINNLHPLAHTVIITMLFNIGFYIIGSLISKTGKDKDEITDKVFNAFKSGEAKKIEDYPTTEQKANINFNEKKKKLFLILSNYLEAKNAENITEEILSTAGLAEKNLLTVKELADLHKLVERTLAGYIGAPSAREAMAKSGLISESEARDLSGYYGRIIADLKLTPQELSQKVDYYQEREEFLKKQSQEFESQVKAKTKEMQEKVEELEKFQNITVGRELKMIELKEKIKELEKNNNNA